jgi:hypothetical protein
MLLRLLMFGSIALFGSTTAMTPNGKVVPPRKIVGKFDVAVVRVNEKGALNTWLDKEGFQKLEGAEDVRQWKDDLCMFPYYTDRNMVPHDARPGGAAADTWASPPKLGDR